MKNATINARQKLKLALEITGLSAFAMSKIIGVSDTTLSRLLNAENPPEPRVSTIEGIDKAVLDFIERGDANSAQIALFESEYKSLLTDRPQGHPGHQGIIANMMTEIPLTGPFFENKAPKKNEVEHANPPRPYMADYLTDPRSIPVLGTAAGSALGAFEIGNEAIDHVRRPPGLAGIKEIYAIYVVGESMVPEHNPGDLRIIHPHRPAKPGDSVVIQTYNAATDTREAFIKRLISMNGHEVKCYQHNPHLDITYIRPNGDPNANNTDETYAIKVHKVLTVNELHGF